MVVKGSKYSFRGPLQSGLLSSVSWKGPEIGHQFASHGFAGLELFLISCDAAVLRLPPRPPWMAQSLGCSQRRLSVSAAWVIARPQVSAGTSNRTAAATLTTSEPM